ncbi:MAG TPA: hypothetical protein VGD67_05280 [Pseudonocardiaceae bacterium]
MTTTHADPPAATAPSRPRVTRVLLVVVLALHAALAVLQPIFAGSYLSGSIDAMTVHGISGSLVTVVCLAQLVVAALFWRPGRGPAWPLLATVALFLAEGVQLGVGYTRTLAIHLPLGVAIVGCTVAMFIWSLAWRPAAPEVRP